MTLRQRELRKLLLDKDIEIFGIVETKATKERFEEAPTYNYDDTINCILPLLGQAERGGMDEHVGIEGGKRYESK